MGINYNYNSINHHLVIDGIRLVDYGKDSKFKITYDGDFRTLQNGVEGNSTTSERHERSASISVKIQQASPLNFILERMAHSAKRFPVLYMNGDFSGDLGKKGENAFFVKEADTDISGDSGDREWTIKVPHFIPMTDVAIDLISKFGG